MKHNATLNWLSSGISSLWQNNEQSCPNLTNMGIAEQRDELNCSSLYLPGYPFWASTYHHCNSDQAQRDFERAEQWYLKSLAISTSRKTGHYEQRMVLQVCTYAGQLGLLAAWVISKNATTLGDGCPMVY